MLCEDNSSAHHEDQELSKLEIPVDDDSPITVRDLLKNYIIEELPLIPMNFNLKLFLLFFVVFPFFLHLKLAVILFYNQEYHQEADRKHENCKAAGGQLFDVCFMAQLEWQKVLSNWHIIAPPAYVLLLVVCAFIRPKDLLYRSAITNCLFKLCNSPSLGQEMVEHLKAQRQGVYFLFFFYASVIHEVINGMLDETDFERQNRRTETTTGTPLLVRFSLCFPWINYRCSVRCNFYNDSSGRTVFLNFIFITECDFYNLYD